MRRIRAGRAALGTVAVAFAAVFGVFAGGAAHGSTVARRTRWPYRRRAVMLAAALALPLAVLAQASPALAASPKVTITCAATNDCTASGTGFTPSGKVQVQATAGTTVFSTSTLVASAPTRQCVTTSLGKPVCFEVGGGTFTAALPVDYGLICNTTAAGAVQYTDVSSGAAVSEPVTWTGPCVQPTTTTLSIPSTVDTSWSAVNPASVTAGTAYVTSGTITITVNGATACSYTAGASSGCTLSLPAGDDQVQASYAGSAIPPYDPSSASVTVNVLQVQQADLTDDQNAWAGYADTDGTTYYTAVTGSWIVPVVNCANGVATSSATWVGIDGDGNNSSTVEQIGTDSNCILFSPSYWAWFEMWPSGPVTLPANDPVFPGDQMSARVTANGDWSFTLTITDNTADWTFSTTQTNTGAQEASAECITERPDDGGLPLADFGSVTFTGCEATAGNGNAAGVATPIWDHRYKPYELTNGSTVLAVASPLSDDGTQFTVTWQNGN